MADMMMMNPGFPEKWPVYAYAVYNVYTPL